MSMNCQIFQTPFSLTKRKVWASSARAFYFLAGVLINRVNLDVQMGGGLIAINQHIGEAIDLDPKPDVFVSGIFFCEESLELIKVRRLLAEH